jgi:hypothetical protein
MLVCEEMEKQLLVLGLSYLSVPRGDLIKLPSYYPGVTNGSGNRVRT